MDRAWQTFRILPALALVLGYLTFLVPLPGARAQEVPELQITSTAYIVIDADTGEIYAQRNAHERRAPASLTKIFTAIESIEEGAPETVITTTDDDLVSSEASQVGFGPGEAFTVRELLYGLMLPSGNDAAEALARGLGSVEGDSAEQGTQRFLDRLNQRLINMGLTDTHLVNPSGWGVPGHYSSAHDLAAFTMYALRYPRFVQTFGTLEYPSDDGEYIFRNNNRMLKSYPGMVGGKTGYDNDAGWCLVNVAQRDGSRMIAVTLNGVAPDDWYDDNRVLLDYAFEQKALRSAQGTLGTGQIVRYRDPDAAKILAMASASAAILAPVTPAGPVTNTVTVAEAPAQMAVEPAPELGAATVPAQVPEVIAAPGTPGVGGGAFLVAVLVGLSLIALQGVAAWYGRGSRIRRDDATAYAGSD
ncbi:MAG: D-alanyl-D-alanine carboxypeptidase [Thermomicrobiales bacterium]|nr:D-alanyl-D-alanine carboxypeptidase [Thermomicrobiales bacterium]